MQRFLAPSIAPVFAFALLATLFSTNVYRAWTQSITYDEALTYLEFVAPAFSKMGQVYDANNHVLFTLLAKVSIWLLGLSEFSLSLPSLLGGLIYFAACFQLSRLLFGSGFLFLMSVTALALNPYLLDFLSAARGVRISLGPVVLGGVSNRLDNLSPDFHFSFGSANHRVDSDAFIYAGLKALKALRRSTPNG